MIYIFSINKKLCFEESKTYKLDSQNQSNKRELWKWLYVIQMWISEIEIHFLEIVIFFKIAFIHLNLKELLINFFSLKRYWIQNMHILSYLKKCRRIIDYYIKSLAWSHMDLVSICFKNKLVSCIEFCVQWLIVSWKKNDKINRQLI